MRTTPEPRFVTSVIGRLFIVRWQRFRLPDLVAVRAEIAAARRVSTRPLTYLSLIPDSTRTFSPQERDALGAYLRDLFTDCESIHHVIDGEGFVASARRSIVTSLALTSARPTRFETYATFEEAATALARAAGMPNEELVALARERNIPFPAKTG